MTQPELLPASNSELATKVAFCITELDPGGAERALVETLTRLDRSRWTPKVYCLGPEAALVEPLANAGIEVVCFEARSRDVFSAIRRLRQWFRKDRPAVVATSLFHANIVGRLAARGLGIPVIAGHRVAERDARWHLRLERLTNRLVSHHVMVSESVRSFLVDNRVATAESSSVIYNGVDIERFVNAPTIEFDAPGPVLLFAGRLTKQKGLEVLFDAWQEVRQNHADATLLIAGDGPLRSIVESQDGNNGVQSIGYQRDLAGWYRRADLVVLPSRWEGLPNVMLESLAAGTPIVASDVEGVREVLVTQPEWIVPPGDAAALAAAMTTVLADLDTAKKSAESAQATLHERFTWNACAHSWGELLARVAANGH